MTNQDTLALAKALISRPSVTPSDMGCQKLIADRLVSIGFKAVRLRYEEVDNIWLTHGTEQPSLVYVGHTDVVPVGKIDSWQSDPFSPEVNEGYLYGRGAADMKGSIAAMITAVERFITRSPDHLGCLALLLTSDEEGVAMNGTRKVMEYLDEQGFKIDWCLVGEPSSDQVLGDTIKHGRRGSLNASLVIKGKQGHVAYPHLASNPIHQAAAFIAELSTHQWDEGNEEFPPSCLQIVNLGAGLGADNVIPSELKLSFNIRFNPLLNVEQIKQKVEDLLVHHKLNYEINWRLSSLAFLSPSGRLRASIEKAIEKHCSFLPKASTGGGTSDGRFIAPSGAEVVEFGPINATIHQVNECIKVDDLYDLSIIYEHILDDLLT